MSRRNRAASRRTRVERTDPPGVTPLIYLAATRWALEAPVEVEVMAAHAGQLENGLLLHELADAGCAAAAVAIGEAVRISEPPDAAPFRLGRNSGARSVPG